MLKNLSLQIIVFFTIFQLLSWFKTSDMLEIESTISTIPVLTTTTNESISLSAADKKLVLYFFAPWCSICHASIENLQLLYQQNANIDVIAIALDYTQEQEIIDFAKQHQLTFPIAYGNEQVKQLYKVTAYPSYYVISEDNLIKSKSMGYSTEVGLYIRSL